MSTVMVNINLYRASLALAFLFVRYQKYIVKTLDEALVKL